MLKARHFNIKYLRHRQMLGQAIDFASVLLRRHSVGTLAAVSPHCKNIGAGLKLEQCRLGAARRATTSFPVAALRVADRAWAPPPATEQVLAYPMP